MSLLSIAACVPVIGIALIFKANAFQLVNYTKDYAAGHMHTFTSILCLTFTDPSLRLLLLLAYRYHRLVIGLWAYLFVYKADEVPAQPTVTSDNAHVVISTVDPRNKAFNKCVQSILENQPRFLTIAVGGEQHLPATIAALELLRPYHGTTEVRALSIPGNKGNKREQMTMILDQLAEKREENKGTIMVFVDDHAWWDSDSFLAHLLAPFENSKVGLVGTKKRVQRERNSNIVLSGLNFIACIYLERHNFEVTAQNAMDGGAFVISGRTCAIRASIAMEDDFRNDFMNEYFFFGQLGPLSADDDCYITRTVVRKGYELRFQNHPNAIMHTTLGVDGVVAATTIEKLKKFHGQLLRWQRSTWRNSTCNLFTDRTVWKRQKWTTWAGFINMLVNFALFWDLLIVYAWYQSGFEGFTKYHLAAMIIGSKMVKLADFFRHNPRDLVWFPFYVVFAYVHSFYKLWSLLTFWDCSWGGRSTKVVLDTSVSDSTDDDGKPDAPEPVSGHLHHRALHASGQQGQQQSPDSAGSPKDSADTNSDGSIDPPTLPGGDRVSSTNYQRPSIESATPSPTTADHSTEMIAEPESAMPSRNSSVSSTNSFTERYGKHPKTSGQPNVLTPWGTVNTASLHLTPANVREPQQSPRYNTRSSTRSPSPPNMFKSPPLNTFRAPSYASSSSSASRSINAGSSKGSSSSPNSSHSDSLFGRSSKRTTDDFVLISAPSSPLSVSKTFTAPALMLTSDAIATPAYSLPSLLYEPPSTESYHTRRQSETCWHAKVTPPPFTPRTHFTKPMPTPPSNSEVEIVFKKDRSPSPSPSLYASPGPDTRRTRADYKREFVRGDDCHRVHGDGTYLMPRSFGSTRRCRSPEPRYPVVPGRRY